MSGQTWERLLPVEGCDSPDGHTPWEVRRFGSTVPVYCICARCGRHYMIAVLPGDAGEKP